MSKTMTRQEALEYIDRNGMTIVRNDDGEDVLLMPDKDSVPASVWADINQAARAINVCTSYSPPTEHFVDREDSQSGW